MNVKVDGNSGSCLILLSRRTSSSSWGNLRKASSWISDIKFAVKSILFKLSGREIRQNKHVRMCLLKFLKKKKANGLSKLQVKCLESHPFLILYVSVLSLFIYNVIIRIWTVLRKGTNISFSYCFELPVSFFIDLSLKDLEVNTFKISVCSGNLLNGYLLEK